MSLVLEHLAKLTGFRDRDVLDVTLAGALRDLLLPREVAIYRSVGDGEDRRWLTRALLREGDVSASADPLWTDLAMLPRLEDRPERHACLLSQAPVLGSGSPAQAHFPLAHEAHAAGVVEIHTVRPLDAEQLRLVGSILRVYRNFEGLLDYSERDTLTGLLNRKTFDESFLRLTATAAASVPVRAPAAALAVETAAEGDRRAMAGVSSWLAVIDIDHFKHVNDTYGHLIGDEVLLLLSRLMRANFRYHDHLYRFGGEEFVVLMRCNHPSQAATALERLRSRVEGYAFPQVGRITVSMGFTALRPADAPAAAFERADKAVYWVKQHGRNGVADHADLVARGELAEASRDSNVELF